MSTPKTPRIQIGTAKRQLYAADDALLSENLIIITPAEYTEFLKHLNRTAAPSERLQKTMQVASPWDRK